MKIQYNKEDDILMIQLLDKKIDDSYESDNMIFHIAQDKELVLLEIFDATHFLKDINKKLPVKVKKDLYRELEDQMRHIPGN